MWDEMGWVDAMQCNMHAGLNVMFDDDRVEDLWCGIICGFMDGMGWDGMEGVGFWVGDVRGWMCMCCGVYVVCRK